MTQQVEVPLGENRAYPIIIGEEILSKTKTWGEVANARRIALITSKTIAELWLDQVSTALNDKPETIFVRDGENTKSFDDYKALLDELIRRKFDRTTPIIALGGGVIGDLTGFVAATFLRGVPYVQVPTTLLAQVDASVGGKTAINHPSGKNLIGVFYQPQRVVIDTNTLQTLPDDIFNEGMAEVIKYGMIADAAFFEWIETNRERLLARDQAYLTSAIKRSCEIKAAIVAEDERETNKRLLLNFGHTFGHAIERTTGFGSLLHGEAVSIGMVLATKLSIQQQLIDPATLDRLIRLLEDFRLPVQIDSAYADQILDSMTMDKKVIHGKLRLIVVNRIGQATIAEAIPKDALRAVLQN